MFKPSIIFLPFTYCHSWYFLSLACVSLGLKYFCLTCTEPLFCRNLTELDIQENGIDDLGGDWLSCFPESLTSLEVLNFASLNSEVSFDALEKLVARCKSLRVLKVNRNISLDQLQKLLLRAPQLTELGTGTFTQDLVTRPVTELENTFRNCKNLLTISGFWDTNSLYLPVIYPACENLTFLNLSYATLRSFELAMLLMHCKSLRRLWVCTFSINKYFLIKYRIGCVAVLMFLWLLFIKYNLNSIMAKPIQVS